MLSKVLFQRVFIVGISVTMGLVNFVQAKEDVIEPLPIEFNDQTLDQSRQAIQKFSQKQVKSNDLINKFNDGRKTHYTVIDKAKPESAKVTPPTERAKEKRNPFSVTDLIRPKKKTAAPASNFKTMETPQQMPAMRLRGHLQGSEGEIVALLEIEGGAVHIVREGDTIGLHEFGYDSVIRVKKIDRLHLVVESGSLGQLIVVR